jgi:hypothetical protein
MIKLFNKTKEYTLEEIHAKVKSNEIKVEYNGHYPNDFKYMLDREIENYKRDLDSKDVKRIADAKYHLSSKTRVGQFLRGGYSSSCQCFACDERLVYVLMDENTITAASEEFRFDSLDSKKFSNEYIKHCEGEKLMKSKFLTAEIQAPTGKIVFQNYFNNEEIYELPKQERYNPPTINCIMGRNKLMQYLAAKNVGYGQMGNMGITIYANNTEIIITEESFEGPNKKMRHYLKNNGYSKIGEISLRVWRWMCADVSVLKQYNEEATGIIIDMQPGTYVIEHYAHALLKKDLPIWSRIKLKQDDKQGK